MRRNGCGPIVVIYWHCLYRLKKSMNNTSEYFRSRIVWGNLDCKNALSWRHFRKGKVKCTLVQALRLCTGRTAHRGSRGIALLFHDHGTRRGWRGQRHAPTALYPRKRPGTHCTGSWVGVRAGLNRCGKSLPHRDSIPGPSSPWPVAIPTEIPDPRHFRTFRILLRYDGLSKLKYGIQHV